MNRDKSASVNQAVRQLCAKAVDLESTMRYLAISQSAEVLMSAR
jgi:hypothetical protein